MVCVSRRAMHNGEKLRIGSKTEVFNGHAHRTSGGLTRADLVYFKGKGVVSKKKHEIGKKMYKNLEERNKRFQEWLKYHDNGSMHAHRSRSSSSHHSAAACRVPSAHGYNLRRR